ncbi:helicase [Aureococcus anophagefferens]|nr:helicase [Aureococcus anophagefferens]
MMTLLAPMTIESDAELSDEEGSDEEFGLEAYDDGEYRTVERAAPAAPAAPAPARRRAAGGGAINFDELGLCRCLLRAVAALGFSRPTAIQERVVPLALAGRDVCASAATGSGKTAAFGLPLLERVVRAKAAHGKPTIRGVILLPTRELAAQCEEMVRGLGQFSGADVALVVGGAKDVKVQELALRRKPDVVVATPGRLLDHLTNGRGVHLDDVECCVLDEADRLLELGFEDELRQLLGALPGGSERGKGGRGSGTRQTMLFSAAFGAKVEPRGAAVVFFDTKAATRRVGALLEALRARGGLSGHALPPATELHGGLRQAQRREFGALERGGGHPAVHGRRRAGLTSPASAPSSTSRCRAPWRPTCTAWAARRGRSGHAVTLVGPQRRQALKEFLRSRTAQLDAARDAGDAGAAAELESAGLRSRAVPPAVLAEWRDAVGAAEADVAGLLALAAADRELSRAAEDAQRAENLLVHGADIAARRKRVVPVAEAEARRRRAKAEVDALDKQRDLAEVRKRADDLPTRRERDPGVGEAAPAQPAQAAAPRGAAEEVFAEERKQALQDAAEARATKPKKPKKAKQARAAGFEAAGFDDAAQRQRRRRGRGASAVSLRKKKAAKGAFKSKGRFKRR